MPFGIVLTKDVMLPVRDGARPPTDIFQPARDRESVAGRFLTVLCRTPYEEWKRRSIEIADHRVPQGYGVCLQGARDRCGSEDIESSPCFVGLNEWCMPQQVGEWCGGLTTRWISTAGE